MPLRSSIHAFDAAVRVFVQQAASPALTYVMRGFTLFGELPVLGALAVLVVAIFLRGGRRREAWLFAIVMAGGEILDQVLKFGFHRARPQPFFGILAPTSYSFPSGHAMMSACFFGMLAWLLTAREPRRGARIAVWIAAALLAGLIGFSRVYLGVHYATDVIAGYATAMVWVFMVAASARVPTRHA